MKSRRILALALTLVLLAGASVALGASAGSREDPLISKSYADTDFTRQVLGDASAAIDFTLQQLISQSKGENTPGSTGNFTVQSVGAGSSAVMNLGDSVVLLSGEAQISISAGTVVNVSVGAAAGNGKLNLNQRYLACEDTQAVVSFSQASTIAVDGSVEVSGSVCPFTDVYPHNWYYQDVVAAVDRGLIDGMTPSTYVPGGTLTAAQCVKLAACMHQLWNQGQVTLTNSPTAPWYRSYVDYALANGILLQEYADYNAVIARQQFVALFYRALPAGSYTPINNIPDDSIPDVHMQDVNAAEIYTFYRAGILTGYTNSADYVDHAFGSGAISRAEVATIMNRMFDPSARKSFTLG